MNLDRLSLGEKLLGITSIALIVLSFAGLWAKIEIVSEGPAADLGFDATQRFNAWDAYGLFVKLALLIALVLAGFVVARAANANLTLPSPKVYLGLAIAAFVLLLLTLLVGPDESGSGSNDLVSVEISRGLGLFIGTFLGAAMAVGAWMHAQASGSAGASPDATV